jgi:hypothetical protein
VLPQHLPDGFVYPACGTEERVDFIEHTGVAGVAFDSRADWVETLEQPCELNVEVYQTVQVVKRCQNAIPQVVLLIIVCYGMGLINSKKVNSPFCQRTTFAVNDSKGKAEVNRQFRCRNETQ